MAFVEGVCGGGAIRMVECLMDDGYGQPKELTFRNIRHAAYHLRW